MFFRTIWDKTALVSFQKHKEITNLGNLSQIALKNMQLLTQIKKHFRMFLEITSLYKKQNRLIFENEFLISGFLLYQDSSEEVIGDLIRIILTFEFNNKFYRVSSEKVWMKDFNSDLFITLIQSALISLCPVNL